MGWLADMKKVNLRQRNEEADRRDEQERQFKS